MATPIPSGNATSADQNEITSVPTTSGSTPNCASRKSGAQVVPVKKSDRAHLAEELERRQEQREDDADGRQHRDRGGDEQDDVDDLLAPADLLLAGERSPPAERRLTSAVVIYDERVLELLQLLVDLLLAERNEPRLLGDRLLVLERVADEVAELARCPASELFFT